MRISGPASDDLDAVDRLEDRVTEATGGGEFTPLQAEAEFAHALHPGRAITAEIRSADAAQDCP